MTVLCSWWLSTYLRTGLYFSLTSTAGHTVYNHKHYSLNFWFHAWMWAKQQCRLVTDNYGNESIRCPLFTNNILLGPQSSKPCPQHWSAYCQYVLIRLIHSLWLNELQLTFLSSSPSIASHIWVGRWTLTAAGLMYVIFVLIYRLARVAESLHRQHHPVADSQSQQLLLIMLDICNTWTFLRYRVFFHYFDSIEENYRLTLFHVCPINKKPSSNQYKSLVHQWCEPESIGTQHHRPINGQSASEYCCCLTILLFIFCSALFWFMRNQWKLLLLDLLMILFDHSWMDKI